MNAHLFHRNALFLIFLLSLSSCMAPDSNSSSNETAMDPLRALWKSGSEKIQRAWDETDPIALNTFRIQDDIELGEQADRQLQATENTVDSTAFKALYNRLNRIKNNILQHAQLQHAMDFSWKLTVIKNDSTVNAFCTPGGFIYVYTGLLRYVSSEAELASVLAHEMAHADLRHGTRQLTKQLGLQLIMQFLSGEGGPGLLAEITSNLISLRYSRAYEREADANAVKYLCASAYPPQAGINFFKRILKEDSKNQLQWISTHPDPEERIKNITERSARLNCNPGSEDSKNFCTELKSQLP